jgi:hypothetical protein
MHRLLLLRTPAFAIAPALCIITLSGCAAIYLGPRPGEVKGENLEERAKFQHLFPGAAP